MATAKLWWNGSEWKTSETTWVNEGKAGNQQLAARHKIWIAAYDDATIKMAQETTAYQTGYIYQAYTVYLTKNEVTVKSGSTTIGTGDFSNKAVTSYTSFSYSGVAASHGYASGDYYSGDISFSGSTTITTPFYTVTYNANGGSGAPSSHKGVKGFSTKVANGTPTRSGWTFKGWATSNTATSATYQAGDTITARNSDLPLYAVWYKNITITAPEGVTISFGGTNYTNQTVTVQKAYGTYALSMTAQSGWIIKTRSPAASVTQVVITKDGTTPSNISAISATSQRVGCKIWNGSAWKQGQIYVYNGSQWKLCQAYVWNGSAWKLLN